MRRERMTAMLKEEYLEDCVPVVNKGGRPRSLLYGWGVNDADYSVLKIVDGKQEKCPYYRRWVSVLTRVNSHSAYSNVSICPEWKYFSNFAQWMKDQPWEGWELDKDLLSKDVPYYSPETCAFVPYYINSAIIDRGHDRKRGIPLGVSMVAGDKAMFMVQLTGCLTPEEYSYGVYSSKEECHQAWQIAKASQLKLAAIQYGLDGGCDKRVTEALLEKAYNIQKDSTNYIETTSF